MSTHHDILIAGGGFAGVRAAAAAAAVLARDDADGHSGTRIALVCPDDALTVLPRMYETDLSGARVPLADVLEPLGVTHVRAAVTAVDTELRLVWTDRTDGDGDGRLSYEQLVLALGAEMAVPPGAEHAHRVDDWSGAAALNARLARLPAGGRVTIVGGGFAGIELAAELAGRARVTLLERGDRIAAGYGPGARRRIADTLDALGVEVRTGAEVEAVQAGGAVRLRAPDASADAGAGGTVEADVVALATGPRAHPLTGRIPGERDARGRLLVDEHLHASADGVWVAGDVAAARVDDAGNVAPMACQHAGPMGLVAGANAVAALLGREPRTYAQPMYVTCLDLGAAGALVTLGFDRDRVIGTGAAGKAFKRFINRSLIYPPDGRDAAALRRWGLAPPGGRGAEPGLRVALRSARLSGLAFGRAPDRAAAFAGVRA